LHSTPLSQLAHSFLHGWQMSFDVLYFFSPHSVKQEPLSKTSSLFLHVKHLLFVSFPPDEQVAHLEWHFSHEWVLVFKYYPEKQLVQPFLLHEAHKDLHGTHVFPSW
jgi:hypothetical protein